MTNKLVDRSVDVVDRLHMLDDRAFARIMHSADMNWEGVGPLAKHAIAEINRLRGRVHVLESRVGAARRTLTPSSETA